MRPWARIVSPRDRGKNPYPSAPKGSGGYQLDGEAAPSTAVCCVKYATAKERPGGSRSEAADSITLAVAVGDEDGYIWACQPASRSQALEPFRAHMAPVCGVKYLDSEQLLCAAGSFVLASSGRDGECSVWRCQALAPGQLPEGRPQVQQIVRVRSAIGSFCAARFLAWPAPNPPASGTETSAKSQVRARVLVAAPGCGEGGAFLCLCGEESEQNAEGGGIGVTSESKFQGVEGKGAQEAGPWGDGGSWSQAWGCLLGPPEAPPGDIAAEALGMDRLKKKKKMRKKKKKQAGLMHLQGLDPAPDSEDEDEDEEDDGPGSPSSSMPGEAILMHIDLVPQLRGALMMRSYDGGVVSCDSVSIPGVSGASHSRAPEVGRKTVSARAARCSVLCTATAPARVLGASHGGEARPHLVACGTSSRVLSFLVLRMKEGRLGGDSVNRSTRGSRGAGAGIGQGSLDGAGAGIGKGVLKTAKRTASGGDRPLVEEVGVDGDEDGGESVHLESASAAAPTPADGSTSGSTTKGSQAGQALVPESMCLGLALQLPTKGIAEVKWIPEEKEDKEGTASRRRGSAGGPASGAGASAGDRAYHSWQGDVAGHSSGPCSLLGVACWDGTLRLVRACVTSASDAEMRARRRGMSIQGGLLEGAGLEYDGKGKGKGNGKVKGWMPQALGPWDVRASQVMVLGAAAPHSGLMLAGAAAAAAAAVRPGPISRFAHEDEDGTPVGKRYLLDRTEKEASASDVTSVTKTGTSEQQVSVQSDALRVRQQEQQELSVLAEEFGIKSLDSGGLLRLAGARRRAAVAEAVGRGTNRAGGLLAAAPSREAQAVGWDPVSASAGPVHAGGATGIGVTSAGGGGVVLAAGDKSGAVTAWLPLG